MTRTSKIVLASVLGIGAIAAAGAVTAGGGHWGGKHGWGHGGMHRGGMHLMAIYDADKDGKLTQAEIDTGRAGQFAEFDADKDGALSLDEYQALWASAMRPMMVDLFQKHDDDGDARVTMDEFTSRSRHMVDYMDRDGDGAIGAGDRGHGMRHWDGHHGDHRDDDKDD